MDVSKDYYKILDIKQSSTKKEVRSAYLKLAKIWHPDLHKNEKEKKKARDKFIEIQAAYEVLHDDADRKKYDEMRRLGVSQDQYKYQEAYRRQYGQTPRSGSNPYQDQFQRNMQMEWEKIRREQQQWASARRSERHQYSDQFPFGNMGGGATGGQGNPFGFGMSDDGRNQHQHHQIVNPFEGFFRTFVSIFAVFMAFRLIGFLLFGPPRDRRRDQMGSGYDPYLDQHRKGRGGRESPFYSPQEYSKYNHRNPPPYSLKESDESRRERKLERGPYRPPIPPIVDGNRNGNRSSSQPRPRNSLKNDRRFKNLNRNDGGDGDEMDISFNGSKYDSLKKKSSNRKKTKYEKMLEEQRMMEEVYIRARRKQMEEQEFERQRSMNKKFGRGGDRRPPPPQPSGEEDDDVNKAWERYLNGERGKNGSWRRNRPS